ncbi:hypothetical protein E5F76_003908, partial [Salmonella enterica]|nr:hypothetical protein [Salmonella enterica]
MNTAQLPKKANIYKAMFYFFFSKKKFITLGAINNMAFELECPNKRSEWKSGKYNSNIEDHKNKLDEYTDDLRKACLISFSIMFIIFLIVTIIGFYLGKFNLNRSINWSSVCSFCGLFSLSWATLFQLGWRSSSWKGIRLDELVATAIFRHVFIFGSFLSLLY